MRIAKCRIGDGVAEGEGAVEEAGEGRHGVAVGLVQEGGKEDVLYVAVGKPGGDKLAEATDAHGGEHFHYPPFPGEVGHEHRPVVAVGSRVGQYVYVKGTERCTVGGTQRLLGFAGPFPHPTIYTKKLHFSDS